MVVDDLPIVEANAETMDVISVITGSRLGLAVVKTESGWGVITDGDVRRAIEKFGQDVFARVAADLMTPTPASVSVGTRVEDALVKMERHSISSLLVFNGDELAGVLKK